MTLNAGTVYVDVKPDTSSMTKKGSGGLASSMKTAGLLAAGAFAVSFISGGIGEAKEAEKVGLAFSDSFNKGADAKLFDSAAIAAKFDEINNALGVSDEELQTWATHFNNAIDFSKFGAQADEMLTDMTTLVVDIAARTGKSTTAIEKTMVKLGTAPETAIPMMEKLGVLTQEQSDHALKLIEAGKIEEAQMYAVAKATEATSGAAAAQVTESEKMSIAYAEIQEKVGSALLPALNGLASVGIKVLDFFTSGTPLAKAATIAIGALGAAMLVLKVQTALAAEEGMLYLAKTAIIKTATAAWTAVQWLLNAAMSANPIGLVVIAIVALAAAFMVAWKKSETFREIVTKVFETVKTFVLKVWDILKHALITYFNVYKRIFETLLAIAKRIWDTIKGVVTGVWDVLKKAVETYFNVYKRIFETVLAVARNIWDSVKNVVVGAWTAIKNAWSGVQSFFSDVFNGVKERASDIWDSIVGAFKGAINSVIGFWNRLDFSIDFTLPNVKFVPGLDGQHITTPDLIPDVPYLAEGGIVSAPTLAVIGEAGPEAVVPLGGRSGVLQVRVVNPNDFPDGAAAVALATRQERMHR